MHIKSLAIVLLRVVAVFKISQGFIFVGQFTTFMYRAPQDSDIPLWALGLAILTPIVVGLIIWFISPAVADLAVRERMPSVDTQNITAQGLGHAAFIVVGVWLFLTSLASLVPAAFQLFAIDGTASIPWVIARLLGCIFGIGLVTGSRNISKALFRLRYAGASEPNL